MTKILTEHFIVEGVVPLNHEDMRREIERSREILVGEVKEAIDNSLEPFRTSLLAIQGGDGRYHSSPDSRFPSSDLSNENPVGNRFRLWTYRGGLRMIPPDIVFPQGTTTKALWNLWWFGDEVRRIQPYRMLAESQYRNDLASKKQRDLVSKAQTTIMEIVNIVHQRSDAAGEDRADFNALSRQQSSSLFEYGYMELMRKLYGIGRSQRFDDKVYTTVANRLYSAKKKSSIL